MATNQPGTSESRRIIHDALSGLNAIRARIQLLRRTIEGKDGEPATKHIPALKATVGLIMKNAQRLRDQDSQLSEK